MLLGAPGRTPNLARHAGVGASCVARLANQICALLEGREAQKIVVQSRHPSRKHFLPALAALNIPAVRWHELRHFYASACAAAGIPIEHAAKYMGDANIATMYKHNLHLFGDDYIDDMDRLEAVASRSARPMQAIGQ